MSETEAEKAARRAGFRDGLYGALGHAYDEAARQADDCRNTKATLVCEGVAERIRSHIEVLEAQTVQETVCEEAGK